MQVAEFTKCPACGSEDLDTDQEFLPGLCTACGLVFTEDVLSNLPNSGDESDGIEENSHSSIEDWKKTVSVQDSSDENLVDLLDRTNTIGEELDIGAENQIKAGEFAKQAWVIGFTHGRSLDAVAGATVLLAGRVSSEAYPIDVVATIANTNSSLMSDTLRSLADEIESEIGPAHPPDYIPFIRDWFEIPAPIVEKTYTILENSGDRCSGNPAGIAAGAVYIAVQDEDYDVTYAALGQAVGLTKETIWRRTDELRREA